MCRSDVKVEAKSADAERVILPSARSGSASDSEFSGRYVPSLLAGAMIVLLGSLAHVLASGASGAGLGDPAVLGLAVAAVAGCVIAGVALLAVLLKRQQGTAARLLLLLGFVLVVGYAAAVALLTGDLAGAGLVGLAVVAGVTFGDSRWLVGFAATSAVFWSAVVMISAPLGQWVIPVLVVLVSAGLASLLETARCQTREELRASESEWEHSSATDRATGLASREGLALAGARMVEAARRQGDAVHCVFLEVSGLDVVGDRLGTEASDEVRAAVAEALAEGIRGTDVAARWDTEVFCVVGPGVGVSPLELERRVHERLTARPPVSIEFWSPRVTAAAATLPPWEDGNLNTLLSLGEQVMQVRRVLRGGRPRSRRTDQPRPGLSD